MDKLKELVDRVTRFFLRILPASKFSLPITQEAVKKAFMEAEFCFKVSSIHNSSSVYGPVIGELEMQFPLAEAPKLLFLSLCDNIKLSSALLLYARQVFDKVTIGDTETVPETQKPDLESWLCEHQRGLLRDHWVKVNSLLRGQSGHAYASSKSYLWWSEMRIKSETEVVSKVVQVLNTGKLDKILHGFLFDNQEFESLKDLILRTFWDNLNLEQIFNCDVHLLSKVCEENVDLLELLMKIIAVELRKGNSLKSVSDVGELLQSMLVDMNIKAGNNLLNILDKEFRNDKFLQAELVNHLAVKLSR